MTDSNWTPGERFEKEITDELDRLDELDGVPLYDLSIDVDPDPSDWLEWDERERVAAIEEAHRLRLPEGHPTPGGGWMLHASMHCIVENQLAADHPPAARETVTRLRAEGVSRHDAIHALASVVASHLQRAARSRALVGVAAMERDYRALNASVWK